MYHQFLKSRSDPVLFCHFTIFFVATTEIKYELIFHYSLAFYDLHFPLTAFDVMFCHTGTLERLS